ncbi:MAG: SCP2 sterol-binding domain-containing protein [Actinomycetota bacterium]
MAVKFLSSGWADELKRRLNEDPAVAAALGDASVTIQQTIATNDGPVEYWLSVAGGAVDLGIGSVEAPDATIVQDYATAVGLAKREVNAVTAFMIGRIKVHGNVGTLMGLQPALGLLSEHMLAMDIEY